MFGKGLIYFGLIAVVAAITSDSRYLRSKETTSYRNSTEYAKRFLESRRKLEETVRDPDHKKAWQTLEQVDGLKNTEIAIFVTSTDNNNERMMWERIIPSARTWMRNLANAFVIVEDDFLMRFALRQCHVKEYTHYTTFDCHNEPTYLLSRKCSNEYYGWAGPCCKVDDMINYITNDRPDFFANIKYILHGDDDTFFRVDQVMKWLATVDKAGLDDLPLTANANPTHLDWHGLWHIDGCKEMTATGWYQPLMLNHAALKRMSYSSSVYGFSDTCRNFVVTHDVGFEAHAWIMALNHIIMPNTEINGAHKGVEIFRPDIMVLHHVRHDDHDKCREGDEKHWPDHLRYNQKVVVGCGDVDTPGPFHDPKHVADMYDTLHYFQKHGTDLKFENGNYEFYEANVVLKDPTDPVNINSRGVIKIKKILDEKATIENDMFEGEKVVKRLIPRVVPITGHDQTSHGKKYDLTKEWKEFTLNDCDPPGKAT